ncbi:MAG TPA: hypothetical protein VK893_05890 [Pyrinomonadaceae bacterium]|nr:hypothetical protein [Pyrinomonadaceae bacterium]
MPQALTGQPLQTAPPEEVVEEGCETRRGRRRELTLDTAFKNMFLGLAFLIISIALSRTIGAGWWFWMLIPAFLMMGTGVGQLIRLREKYKRVTFEEPRTPAVFPRRTDELRPPVASVTEGTTRHLGVEVPTRHLEHQERK